MISPTMKQAVSRTALAVNLWRARESSRSAASRLFEDGLAPVFLDRRFRWALHLSRLPLVGALVPWSLIWVHSYFAQIPPLRPFLLSGFVRGCVSALGLLQIGMGAIDFLAYCRALKSS